MTSPCRDDVCITCSDQLLALTVEWVADDGATARATLDGETHEISIELLDDVRVGEVVLAHGGAALQRADMVHSGAASQRAEAEVGE